MGYYVQDDQAETKHVRFEGPVAYYLASLYLYQLWSQEWHRAQNGGLLKALLGHHFAAADITELDG